MPKITNICKDAAQDIIYLPKNTVMISISEEHDPEWKLKVHGENVLRLKFSDVRAVTPHKGKNYNPMSVGQAQQIIEFIEKNKDKDIIVNCAQGVSRSSAVALYAHIVHGYSLKKNFYLTSLPNPYVLGTLISEFYFLKNNL